MDIDTLVSRRNALSQEMGQLLLRLFCLDTVLNELAPTPGRPPKNDAVGAALAATASPDTCGRVAPASPDPAELGEAALAVLTARGPLPRGGIVSELRQLWGLTAQQVAALRLPDKLSHALEDLKLAGRAVCHRRGQERLWAVVATSPEEDEATGPRGDGEGEPARGHENV